MVDQKLAKVAAVSNQSFVVVFESTVSTPDIPGATRQQRILARLFSNSMEPLGDEWEITGWMDSRKDTLPAVASVSGGGFIVTWIHTPLDEQGQNSKGTYLFARIFHSNGSSNTESFVLNTMHSVLNDGQGVATLADGRFVACGRGGRRTAPEERTLVHNISTLPASVSVRSFK